MKKLILAVLMVAMVTTPCFAQEVETDGIFSIEETQWLATPILAPKDFSKHYYSFWEGKVYISRDKEDYPYHVINNSFYMNLLGVSFYSVAFGEGGMGFPRRVGELGFMSPPGFGIATEVRCVMWAFPICQPALYTLLKVDDNLPPVLINPGTLEFDATETSMTLRLRVAQDINWRIGCGKPWVTFNPDNGKGGIYDIDVTVDRTGLYPGLYGCSSLGVFSGDELLREFTVRMAVSNFPENGDWKIETVDNVSDSGINLEVGDAPSLALDSNDKAHISYVDVFYGDDKLKYATNAAGDWVIETVDGYDIVDSNIDYAYRDPSLALDSNDKAHICYVSFTDLVLEASDFIIKYVTNVSGDWVIETVDSAEIASNTYSFPSLALDSNDKAHIIYIDSTSKNTLKYATNASGDWVIETVDSIDSNIYPNPSLALDSNDKAHISYVSFTDDGLYGSDFIIKYATNASDSWVIENLDFSMGRVRTSLALDSNDKVHISLNYTYSGPPDNYALKYTTNTSGNWVMETVDCGSFEGDPSLALDSNGRAYISCTYWGTVYVATNAAGDWTIKTLEGGIGELVRETSLALDSNDKAHIGYAKGAFGPLEIKYAQRK